MRISDWSSDVCSSDLEQPGQGGHDDELAQHAYGYRAGALEHLGKVVLGQGQPHAEHDDAQQRHDIGCDPCELLGDEEGEYCKEQYPDGKCLDRKSTRLNSSH